MYTLVDEDGHRHEFTLIEVIEVDQRRYAVLQPVDAAEDEAEAEAVIFRVENDTLVTIEDDAEIERVVEALEAMDVYDNVTVLDRERDDPESGA